MKLLKNSNKAICCFLISVYLLLVGYTYPQDNCPYVVVNCNFGTNFVITFPANVAQWIILDGTDLINISNNTVYGYCSDGERINFPCYDTPYRTISYQQTAYLSITNVIENHLVDYSSRNVFSNNYQTIILGTIGGLLLCSLLLVIKH